MDRTKYLNLLLNKQDSLILYEYHLDKSNKKLPWQKFTTYIKQLQMLDNIGIFNLGSFLNYVKTYYDSKFYIVYLLDNKGVILSID